MNPHLKKGFGIGGRIDRALHADVALSFAPGTDEFWMELALLESMNSIGISSPNPAVGCVLVQNNEAVGRGHTQAFRKEHAERMAFQTYDRAADLSQVTVYVTLEPCSHQGNQPPCVDLLVHSPIPRIVIAARDPDPRVNGEGIRKLKEAGKDVVLSVLEAECRAWNFPFFRGRKTGKPVWIAKWAETPSGHLADANGHSKWITNLQSRAYTHWLRQKYDAIVVGAGTFLADSPKLTVRDCALPHHRNPERWVFDPKGRLLGEDPKRLEGFKVLICESVLKAAQSPLPKEVVSVPTSPKSSDLWKALIATAESIPTPAPLQSVMVEGGAALLRGLFQEELFQGVHQFRGARDFRTQGGEAYRADWEWGPGWKLQCLQEFEQDVLREWTKED
jgi:diaminohydroxyphosphoribosylaminopyrimidine deaminase/5-amino-6-(5-phosphoribosylamino)uracil reductase